MADAIRPGSTREDEPDPVVEAYTRDVDRSLLRENLKLTPDQRLRKLSAFVRFLDKARQSRTTKT